MNNLVSSQFVSALRQRHSLSVMVSDLVLCVGAGLTAYLLRFDFAIPAQRVPILWQSLLIWAVVKAAVFYVADMHRFAWRYTSTHDIQRLLSANLVGSTISALILFIWAGIPRSLPIVDFVLCVAFTAGARLGVRLMSEHTESKRVRKHANAINALIYGAGDAGIALLRELRKNPHLRYEVWGFLDDDPTKAGAYIHGLRVLGNGQNLKQLAVQYSIEHVLVCIPAASGEEMRLIHETCLEAGVVCRTMPAIAEVVEGRQLANQIRDISIEDLLGRKPVVLDQQAIMNAIANEVVIVTGAAGSIGSEMCRQIARFHPAAIVGYEVAETPLFYLEREMRQRFPDVPFFPEVGSIQDARRLSEVLRKHRPKILYHAAAYKHVPMMEANPFEAVANNVFGTETVVRTAKAEGVRSFVMISTDKAVRPTNVMGTTKRIAELLVSAHSSEQMKCVSVRFGNVLGSNGSVIPVFKQQIAEGGPVTVTHPEMRRYFMTIPEAAQLVLQAAAIGRSGETLVLEMGELVKIVDLARNLIHLAGLKPDVDIKIHFTGIRPGEKLYEEINLGDESMVPTSHEKIQVFKGQGWNPASMGRHLGDLRRAWDARELDTMIQLMKNAVPEYAVNQDLLERPVVVESTSADSDLKLILLSNLNHQISVQMVEHTEPFVTLRAGSSVTIGAAVKLETEDAVLLGEICSCSPASDEDVTLILKVEHRLAHARAF